MISIKENVNSVEEFNYLYDAVGWGSYDKKVSEKAKDEYKKYQVKTISPEEKEYLETLKAISNKIDDKAKSE
ncbi:MAG: hypothetical protein Q4E39_00465 [bacterium]|nr:hypothetical protein [bacterium]